MVASAAASPQSPPAVVSARDGAPLPTPPLARASVLSAAAAVAVVLSATSNAYGYHRDELYFRMLPAAWGYVDQPPLAPALARGVSALVDQPWALRVPSTLAAIVTVLLTALVTRELGGGHRAQTLAAWGVGFGAYPLAFGHLLLTSGIDLMMWVALLLALVRALVRSGTAAGRRWWLGVGAAAGLATYDKLLVSLLVAALVTGIAVAGPWRLPWRWVGLGAVLGLVLALPTVVFQATHGWPQIEMGRALGSKHASETRVLMWPLLLLLLGPLLVPIWARGWWQLLRSPRWRPVRGLAVAFVALLALTFVGGGQVYYPLGLLVVLFAAGCVGADEVGRRGWRTLVVGVSLNGLVAAVISLQLVPVSVLALTPVIAVNQAAGDQVGWPTYVRQVGGVYDALPPAERAVALVVAGNYGEAGAIDRYGATYGLPRPFSGHNALAEEAPPDTRAPAVVVGEGAVRVASRFATCAVVTRLDNGADLAHPVDNEEQGEPVAVCRDPRQTWAQVWPAFRHLD